MWLQQDLQIASGIDESNLQKAPMFAKDETKQHVAHELDEAKWLLAGFEFLPSQLRHSQIASSSRTRAYRWGAELFENIFITEL